MKICEECQGLFGEERTVCPDCGKALAEATAEQEAEINARKDKVLEEELNRGSQLKLSLWQLVGAAFLALYAVGSIVLSAVIAGGTTDPIRQESLADFSIDIVCANFPVMIILIFPDLYYNFKRIRTNLVDVYPREIAPAKFYKKVLAVLLIAALLVDVLLTAKVLFF